MYAHYPTFPGHAPLPSEKYSDSKRSVYCFVVVYTLAIGFVGYLVGKQVFDRVDQARFEASHWKLQSDTWKEKINSYKKFFNERGRMAPGEPEPCPICEDCGPPEFCYHDKGVQCPLDECFDSADAKAEDSSDWSSLKRSGDAILPGENSPTPIRIRAKNPKTSKAKETDAYDPQALFISHAERVKHHVNSAYGTMVSFANQLPSSFLPRPLGSLPDRNIDELAEPGKCLACDVCTQQDCDQQAVLSKLDEADKEYQDMRPLAGIPGQRTKIIHKVQLRKESYDGWVRCLTLTLPASAEAYQEALKGRASG